MPSGPLLLVDRVTGIDAEPLSMQPGARLVTELEVAPGAWYFDAAGRMAPGPFVEAGQADLLLMSWLGVDTLLAGDRAYRLLGCTLTFHGPLPRVGQTLRFEITVDSHARQDDLRLLFFHYTCTVDGRLALSLDNGQAGYFTRAELDGSRGAQPLVRPTDLGTPATAWPAGQVRGDWDRARVEELRGTWLAAGRLNLLDDVPVIDTTGGSHRMGTLTARFHIGPGAWFFGYHFHDDPCMPGTLMLEAAEQAVQLFMIAAGLTEGRPDGRFEPVPGIGLELLCRGQVTPGDTLLEYDVDVTAAEPGDIPAVVADVSCRARDIVLFVARNVSVRLVPELSPVKGPRA